LNLLSKQLVSNVACFNFSLYRYDEANSLWAIARLAGDAKGEAAAAAAEVEIDWVKVVRMLNTEAKRTCGDMTGQEFANTLWAWAKLREKGFHVAGAAVQLLHSLFLQLTTLELISVPGLVTQPLNTEM
jgi:hypothetical protein